LINNSLTFNLEHIIKVIIKILGFSNWKFWLKKPNFNKVKKTPYHFGQIDFNMSSVTKVVFFTSKVKTI